MTVWKDTWTVCVCVCIHVCVCVSQRPGWFHDSTGHRRDNKLQQSSSWGPVMWGSVCVCIVCMCTLHWANKWLSVLKEISNFKIFQSKNWQICKFYVIIMQLSILVNKKLTQAMKKIVFNLLHNFRSENNYFIWRGTKVREQTGTISITVVEN